MAGYFVAERRQWQPGCVAEPEKVLQFKSISIEPNPDDAARRLQLELFVYFLNGRLGSEAARLKLDVPEYSPTLNNQVISGRVGLCPQDLDATELELPK